MRQGERERVGSGPIAASHRSYWGGDSSVFLSLSFSPFFIYIYFPSFFYIFYDDSFFYVYVGTGRRRPFWDSTDPISRLYISVTFLSFSLSLLLPARVLQEKEDRKKNDRREWGKEKGVGFLPFSFCAEPLLSVSHSLATPETDNIYYITLYNLPPHPYPRPPIPIFRRNIFFSFFLGGMKCLAYKTQGEIFSCPSVITVFRWWARVMWETIKKPFIARDTCRWCGRE